MTTRPAEVEAFARAYPERARRVQLIKCPRETCRADIGRRCKTPTGVTTWWHEVRRRAAGVTDEMGNWL